MTILAFGLILLSVFLHTGWNFLTKAHHPSVAFLFVVNAVAALVQLPFAVFARIAWSQLPEKFWLFLAGSVIAQIIYACGVAKSYQKNDISTAYPLMRALPVLSVAAVTLIFGLGKTPSGIAMTGMGIVAAGCFVLPQKDFRALCWRDCFGPALLPILIAALGSTGYTICDSEALAILNRHSFANPLMNAGAYSCVMEVLVSLGLGAYVISIPAERHLLGKNCLNSRYPYFCGIFSSAAYLLVLIAMSHVTNVSFLQAFRQMSLPLGVAAGIIFLHEKNSAPKTVGVGLIVLGLILTVLQK